MYILYLQHILEKSNLELGFRGQVELSLRTDALVIEITML